MSPARPDQYVFITPVWGEAYVERFVKVCLPSQLSAGNLGAVPAARSHFLIYTLREHVRTIRRSAAFRQLKEMMPASLLSLDDLPDPQSAGTPHQLQTAAYTRGIRFGEGKQSAYVFLTPDILVGDGGYAHMVELTESGRRVILVAGVRMCSDGAVACVARHRTPAQPDATIPPRALVRACLDHPHPISAGHFVRDGQVRAAQHLYWQVGDHGLLVRGFHLHPLMVWPRDPAANIRGTIDDEYIARACPDRAEWHMVTDSDDVCVIEFSDPGHKVGMVANEPLNDREMLRFIHENTTTDHRLLVRETIRLHSRETSPADWEPVESEASQLVEKHLNAYAEQGVPSVEKPPPPTPPHLRRVPGMLERIRGRGNGPSRLLFAALVPFWVLYRLLNFKLYRYVDRLNAEILDLRAELSATRVQFLQHPPATRSKPKPERRPESQPRRQVRKPR